MDYDVVRRCDCTLGNVLGDEVEVKPVQDQPLSIMVDRKHSRERERERERERDQEGKGTR